MNLTFVCLLITYLIGLLFFLNGFLLTRRVILKYSNNTIPVSKTNEFQQVILIVIDALRYDFIAPNEDFIQTNYHNQMPIVRDLLVTKSNQTILFKLLADPPTTTLQRLKALTTGTLPTFIDLSYNFIGYEIEEDNFLNQIKTHSYQRNISLLGDDTWLALYPNVQFQHLHVYPSFDVHDLDTVDNGILEHLWHVLETTKTQQSSFIIAHFLGVDHCGHRYGPTHIEMKRKLNQMNELIRNLTEFFDRSKSPSILMVIGDHGMTQQGDHGGDEFNEIQTAMFGYTNREDYFSMKTNFEDKVYSQIDLVPTLSWFLHISIPFSSLGMMIIDMIPVEQRYSAMKFNFEQIENYFEEISSSLTLSDRLQELRANLRTIFISMDRQRNLTMIQNLFEQFQFELQSHFRRQWSTFNIFRIVFGMSMMFSSCLIYSFIYFHQSWKSNSWKMIVFNFVILIMFFAISFSNSFIINEGMCLYFLLQTMILIQKMKIQRKLLISICLLITRAFLICREEQQPHCVDPQWLLSKSSDTFDYILPCLSALCWLIILQQTCPRSYFLPYISIFSVIAYWFDVSHVLAIFYISIFIQICCVLMKPSRFDLLIYSMMIFAVGYRFSFVIFVQFLIYSLLLTTSNNNSNRIQSICLVLSLLSEYFFYATGHQPVLSQIRWTAAFPTLNSPLNNLLSSVINSLIVRGLFVLLETFSSQILNIIFIRKFFQRTSQENFLKQMLIVDCWKLLTTSLSVFILRRHLMLWKIFSPRFLFQLIGLIIKFLLALLTIKLRTKN